MLQPLSASISTITLSIFNFVTSWNFFHLVFDTVVILLEDYIFNSTLSDTSLYYLKWFVIVFFAILPIFLIFLLYVTVILYQIYRQDHQIIDDLNEDIQNHEWKLACRRATAAIWKWTAKIWNGYNIVFHEEAEALLNIKQNKDEIPVMIIYYHGALPVDLYYSTMLFTIENDKKQIAPLIDHFMFKVPFFSACLKFWNCISGPRVKIVEKMLAGDAVALAPGGTQEAIFSHNYSLIWKQRYGFADCLLQTCARSKSKKVAVIPMFTKNIRSFLDYPSFIKNKYVELFYEKCRWPIFPLFGGFPVRLTTYFGEPIYITENDTDKKLVADKVKSLLGHHISAHLDLSSNDNKNSSLKKEELEMFEDSFIGHQLSRISSLEYICNSHDKKFSSLRKRTNNNKNDENENERLPESTAKGKTATNHTHQQKTEIKLEKLKTERRKEETPYQELFNRLQNQKYNLQNSSNNNSTFIENLYQIIIDHINFLKLCYQGFLERFKQITPLQEINFKKMQSYNLLPSSEKFALLSQEFARIREKAKIERIKDINDQIHLSYDHLQKTLQDQFVKTCSTLERTYDEVATEIKNTPMKLREISDNMRSRVRCLSSCSNSTSASESVVTRKDSRCSVVSQSSCS